MENYICFLTLSLSLYSSPPFPFHCFIVLVLKSPMGPEALNRSKEIFRRFFIGFTKGEWDFLLQFPTECCVSILIGRKKKRRRRKKRESGERKEVAKSKIDRINHSPRFTNSAIYFLPATRVGRFLLFLSSSSRWITAKVHIRNYHSNGVVWIARTVGVHTKLSRGKVCFCHIDRSKKVVGALSEMIWNRGVGREIIKSIPNRTTNLVFQN